MTLFPLPLSRAPILVQSGLGKHGRFGAPTVEHWRLPDLWCLHFYRYQAQLTIGAEAFSIVPGGASLAPPDTPLVYNYQSKVEHLYAHFSLEPSPAPAPSRGKYWFAPDELAPDFARQMERLIAPAQTGRAQVALWEILWQLAELSPAVALANDCHWSLQRALALIEARLEGEIVIAQLAREVGYRTII